MLGLEHQRAAGDDLLLGKLEGLDRLVELFVAVAEDEPAPSEHAALALTRYRIDLTSA